MGYTDQCDHAAQHHTQRQCDGRDQKRGAHALNVLHPAVLQDERLIKFVEEFLPEAELRAAVEQLFQQFILCGHSHPHFPVLSDFCNLLFPKKGRGSLGASSPWCTVALITQR